MVYVIRYIVLEELAQNNYAIVLYDNLVKSVCIAYRQDYVI